MTSDRVLIFDTTLRDGEQCPGGSMTAEEKLEVARALARLGVDVMESGFPICSPGDFESVKRIAEEIGSPEGAPVICGLARAREADIEAAGKAVAPARRGRIHTFIATSPIHMEVKLRMKPEEVIRAAARAIQHAKTFTDDVEWSAEDAGRSDLSFLVEIVSAAIEAGATTINIPDTVGYQTPTEFGRIISTLRAKVRNADRAVFSVHCHNDLGLAVANSLAGVEAGARQIECTINGIGERAGNTSLEEVVMSLRVRKDHYQIESGIRTQEIYKASRLVTQITGIVVQPNKAIVGANAFAHEAGIHQDGMLKHRGTYEIMHPDDVGVSTSKLVLGKHSGRHAFRTRLEALGYPLPDSEIDRAFEAFKRLADKKKEIFDEDLEALLGDLAKEGRETYALEEYDIEAKSGEARAIVRIRVGGELRSEGADGDGPVDACFKAIDKILAEGETTPSEPPVLEDYQVKSVTRGKDAMGEVTVTVRAGSHRTSGRAASTDILEASAKAYLAARARLVHLSARLTAPGEREAGI